MGWFLWGVTFGWAVCAAFYYSQTGDDKTTNAAAIIGVALGAIAIIMSIGLGIASGAIPHGEPTPTLLGR